MPDWSARLNELAVAAEVTGAVLGIWHDGETTIAPYGVLNAHDRRRDHRRLALPDRLDQQAVDRVDDRPARRRGPVRPGRPDRQVVARGTCRPADHRPSPADPYQWHRRRPVHRHRPRRRLPAAVRRSARGRGPALRARYGVLVLQCRIRAARPLDRGARRPDLGRIAEGPSGRASRPEPHGHPAGRGDPGTRRGRPPGDGRFAGEDVATPAQHRPRRDDQCERGRPARVRPDAPDRRAVRRHAGAAGRRSRPASVASSTSA